MDDGVMLHTQIVHASPGRLRLRLQANGTVTPQLRQIEKTLGSLRGVQSVHGNPTVRSVVITYDAATTGTDDLLAAIGQSGITVDRNLEGSVNGSTNRSLGDSIAEFFQHHDRRVHQRSGGFVDLRTLVPVGLAALALREILSGRMGTAPGYVLLWYAFDTFLKLRKAEGAPDGRVKG